MSREGDRRLRVFRNGEKPEAGEVAAAGLTPKQLFLQSISQQFDVYDAAVVIFVKGERIGDVRGLPDDFFTVQGILSVASLEFPDLRKPLMFDSDE